jgi:hypothetical protein
VSLTFSPLQLAPPIYQLGVSNPFFTVELVVEARAHDHLGIALVGGAGYDSGTAYASDNTAITALAWNVGPEARYYWRSGFRGAYLGGVAYYFRIRSVVHFPAPLIFDFAGYTPGLFIGFKYVGWRGLTVDGHVGVARVFMTESDSADHAGLYPLLDLKVGWSI